MLRFLFRYTVGALALSVVSMAAFTVWAGTSTEEEIEAGTARFAEIVVTPLRVMTEMVFPGPEAFQFSPEGLARFEAEAAQQEATWRRELEAWTPEIESIYDELIRTHEASQSAHTDRWEKRWAGDDVTMARFARKKELESLHKELAKAEGGSAGRAWVIARETKSGVEYELAQARKALEALRGGEVAASR